MSKVEIRQRILGIRKKLPSEVIDEKSKSVCDRIINSNKYKEADVILSYMSIDGEIDLSILNDDAISKNKKVFIPKVLGKHHMEFYKYIKDKYIKGKFGILEPDNDDMFNPEDISNQSINVLMIVPGVAYDGDNNRCGYGGGFYDNYLLRMKEKTFAGNFYAVAPCYDFQTVEKLEEGEFDQKVDEVMVID